MEYNDEQLRAIFSQSPVVIVPAGPGSGKSHTLVGRVVQAVKLGADPSRICILTFTNNGARVFADRLETFGIERLHFMGTLHGYCMRLIQNYGRLIGYRPGTVSIATEEAKKLLLDQVRLDLGMAVGGKKVTDKALKENSTPGARLVWSEYRFRLKRANMIDHDGILRDGLALLKKDSIKLLIELDELLVDERQDSGAIDTEIFWEIPADRRFFVGDGDQCIYAFRGAQPHLFVREAEKYGFISLEHNYRSDKAICEAANTLIRLNGNRIAKRIKPVSTEDGEIVLKNFDHEGDEIYGVWSMIKEEAGQGTSYSQMAVLARTNAIAGKYRDALRGLGVPVTGNGKVFLGAEWPLALSLIGLMVDPANDLHAETVLRARGHSDSEIIEWKVNAARDGRPLSSALVLPRVRPITIPDAMISLRAYVSQQTVELIAERARQLTEDATLSDLLVDLWHPAGWEEKPDGPDVNLTVSTVHGAKGSEWEVVFIVGMEEGVFPSRSSYQMVPVHAAQLGIEEERRLMFVAITRAKHRLYLTWARSRVEYFKSVGKEPSRFIAEMGLTASIYEFDPPR